MKMTIKMNSTSKMKTVPGPSLHNFSFACFPPFGYVINKTKTWNLKGRDEMFSYKSVSGQIIRFCLTPSHGIIPNIKVKKEKCPANDKKCPLCQDIHFLYQSLQDRVRQRRRLCWNLWTSHGWVMKNNEQFIDQKNISIKTSKYDAKSLFVMLNQNNKRIESFKYVSHIFHWLLYMRV